jgi:hypothetical protein
VNGDVRNYANRYQKISSHYDDIKFACPLGLSLCPLGILNMAIGHFQHGRWAGGHGRWAGGHGRWAGGLAVGQVAWPLVR